MTTRRTNRQALRPNWDAKRRELRVNETVVKRFRQPAQNQELILAVFEEDGWPERIDDPLPPDPVRDAKERLHDVIKKLNRAQDVPLIRFRGDGTGTGVLWELLDGETLAQRKRAAPERP